MALPRKKLTIKMALDLIEFLSAEEELARTNVHTGTCDEFINFIYMTIHAINGKCKHPNWEESALRRWQYWHDRGEI